MAGERAAIVELDALLKNGVSESDALRAVIAKHPEQAGFASDYLLSASALGTGQPEPEDASELLAKFDSVAAATAARLKPAAGFRGVSAQAESIGATLSEIAQRLKVGVSVLSRLDGRLISLSTIPERFIESLARELGAQASSISAYLAGRPTLAQGSDYKSRSTPKVTNRQGSFKAAIEMSVNRNEMTAQDAEVWLRLDGENR